MGNIFGDVGSTLGSGLGRLGGEALGSFLGFHNGGKVPGRGTKRYDTVPAMLTHGETVLPYGVPATKRQKKAIAKKNKKGKK